MFCCCLLTHHHEPEQTTSTTVETEQVPKQQVPEQQLECSVCEDEFHPCSVICCYKCENVVCKTCAKQFISMNGTDACCMNETCKTTWSRRFLTENFGSSYVNGTYKKMIDLNRVERVIATNSQFMEDAQQYKTMMKLYKSKKTIETVLKYLRKNKTQLKDRYDNLKIGQSESNSSVLRAKQKYFNMCEKFNKAVNQRFLIVNSYNSIKDIFEKKIILENKGKKVIYQKSCPKQDCNGFLSQNGECGLCKVHVCSKCNTIKGYTKEEISSHECNKDDLESVNAIRKETKPCPRCGTRIHKISGCDQMWCPYCQDKYGEGTTFSWRTGKIERGRIHNPHYMEFMRKNKGNLRRVGNIQCGRLPTWSQIYVCLARFPKNLRKRVENIIRHLEEISQYIVNPIREKLREPNIHRMNQIKHIVGEINDKQFRLAISKTEKRREKDQEILDIYELVVAVLTDKTNELYNTLTTLDLDDRVKAHNIIWCRHVRNYLNFVEKFVREENRCLAEISFIYKQSVNIIHIDTPAENATRMTVRIITNQDMEIFRKHV